MSDFVWINDKGQPQKLHEIHDKHLFNIVKKLYKEAESARTILRTKASSYLDKKQLALTINDTNQEYAHRMFPELDLFLREAWSRGLFTGDKE